MDDDSSNTSQTAYMPDHVDNEPVQNAAQSNEIIASKKSAREQRKRKAQNKLSTFEVIHDAYMRSAEADGQEESENVNAVQSQEQNEVGEESKNKKKNNNKENQTRNNKAVSRLIDFIDHSDDGFSLPLATSSPLAMNNAQNTIHKQNVLIKDLQYRLKAARREITAIRNEQEQNAEKNNDCRFSVCDPYKVYDKVYAYKKELEEELEEDGEGNVLIGKVCSNAEEIKVYCYALAYTESFKGISPFKCLTYLTRGVYKLSDLANRCVRIQTNTSNKQVLCPVKKMVVERKVYAFMRSKYFSLLQIDAFFNKINSHHRTVINNAQLQLKNQAANELERQRVEEAAGLNNSNTSHT